MAERRLHESLPPLKVLVLDNSPDILELLSTDLQCRGCIVTTGSVSAIRHGEIDVARLIDVAVPDVIVFDVALPYEANWRIAMDLQSNPRVRMPFVLTTTNAVAVRRLIGRDLIELVGKPYDLDSLYNVILRSVCSGVPAVPGAPAAPDAPAGPDGPPRERDNERRSGVDRRTNVRRQASKIEPEYL
jgi:CheY-like chemotaxis protein